MKPRSVSRAHHYGICFFRISTDLAVPLLAAHAARPHQHARESTKTASRPPSRPSPPATAERADRPIDTTPPASGRHDDTVTPKRAAAPLGDGVDRVEGGEVDDRRRREVDRDERRVRGGREGVREGLRAVRPLLSEL